MPSAAVTVTGKHLVTNDVTLKLTDDPFVISSGFEGPWTFSPTTLTNDFFKLLFDEKWVWKRWDGPKQLEDKTTRSLMMLPYVLELTPFRSIPDRNFQYRLRPYSGQELQEMG